MIAQTPDPKTREQQPTIERIAGGWRLSAAVWLPRPVDEVFPFFADARNLERLTPGFLTFRVVTPAPIEMKVGTLIDYRLRVRGVPIRWRSRISRWEPGVAFADEQVNGPYRRWSHTHTFEAVAGGTLASDVVEYNVPGGAIAHALFVKRDVRAIFAYRARVMRELFR